jgi:hypothetical protein
MAAFQFPGGAIEVRQPTVPLLAENACEWLGDARLHFDEGERLVADAMDLDRAIEQLAYSVTKINTARMRLIEARELEAMEKGS